MIVWSIEVVKDVAGICDTLVSTDAAAIAEVARAAGALVPWLRPEELASDTASSVEVCLHALDWYENERREVDALLLLQPTSPFRRRDTVERGIELFLAHHRRPVLGISPAAVHPMLCVRVEGEVMRPFVPGGMQLRAQDLPAAYAVNGTFYLISPADLRQRRAFYAEDALPLMIDHPEESIDIDTEWDWRLAESVLAAGSAVVK